MLFKHSLHLAALTVYAAATSLHSQAQSLEKVNASFDGDKVIITYNLSNPSPDEKFKVALYSSHDNYARPLSLVTGDVGESVHSGTGNRVVWGG